MLTFDLLGGLGPDEGLGVRKRQDDNSRSKVSVEDCLAEQGGLETSMSRELFARESPRRVLEKLRAEIR